ncbi:MAG: glycosyltransferase involved in cell wall biosynthesis [Planctomycetota bacterium]|jgi:glycosyltransferase involved in cell wall biosynthesis
MKISDGGARVQILDPSPPGLRGGNRVTALRWAGILRELGCVVRVRKQWDGEDCDVLIALHAIKSRESVLRWRKQRGGAPLIVALTGTDFGDAEARASALQSLQLADHIIVLFGEAKKSLPANLAPRVRVIPQSFRGCSQASAAGDGELVITLLANLRAVKDPLLGARALALRPQLTGLRHVIVGGALDTNLANQMQRAAEADARVQWLGPMRRRAALEVLGNSHALLCTSLHEGGAGSVGEALAFGRAVIATDIPACRALLGDDHPGLFGAGDADALARLLERFVSSSDFRAELQQRSKLRAQHVARPVELDHWRELLTQLKKP